LVKIKQKTIKMKHLLNNLSEEEKNSIREQHTGGMEVSNSRFNSLLENKLGNSKPLVEQFDDEDDYDFEDELEGDENEPYIDLTDKEDDDIHLIHRNMSSDDEELDEDTSWMDDLNEGVAFRKSIADVITQYPNKKGTIQVTADGIIAQIAGEATAFKLY
jgi:hypothetical protein